VFLVTLKLDVMHGVFIVISQSSLYTVKVTKKKCFSNCLI